MIGSQAREALRGQRRHVEQKHHVVLQARERSLICQKNQMHSELQWRVSKRLTWTRSSTRVHFPKCRKLGTQSGAIKGSSCKLRSSWWRLRWRVSKKLQESDRHAVISAQELAAGLESEISTVCDSWKNEVKRLVNNQRMVSRKRFGSWYGRIETIQDSCSTSTKHNLKLWIEKLVRESWR